MLNLYFIILNIAGFILMGVDKFLAIRHMYRISEKCLLLTALFGGALGSTIAMYLFHHKTLHKQFAIGLPVMTVLHVVLYFFVF